jgi:ABC-type branched-subunit amino acid transport system substrate-binding protein
VKTLKLDTGARSFGVVAAMFLLLSWLHFDPGTNGPASSLRTDDGGVVDDESVIDESLAEQGAEGGASGQAGGSRAGTGATGSVRRGGASQPGSKVDPGAANLECKAGRNGGATDTGVTGSKIRLASTAVLDGTASTLLAESVVGMKAVVDKVNRAGGICGRLLDLTVRNDGFKADDGQRIIRNFIEEGYFALPVVPSAEGLGSAIEGQFISRAGIPVVGTDGMREEQYKDPWVWPVASATVTAMRTMAKYGITVRNAKSFAIVYDAKYQFGIEGKNAFVKQVRDMLGSDARIVEVPLEPTKPSFASEVASFNDASQCGPKNEPKCDMIAMLLLPDTAKAWLTPRPVPAKLYTSGAQTLFTDRFAQDCVLQVGEQCHGFAVWTGYNPPVGSLSALPGVDTYVQDVRAVKPSVDVSNQFVEGAYLGMSVFVEALKAVGPNLTRQNLKAVLDAMDFKSDLASTLSWRPGKHAANVRSQTFSMTVNQGAFRGWSNDAGFQLDPAYGG